VNAVEQAKSLELTSKIAAVVNLFKSEFPDAKVDLKPWKNDPDTRELVDPDSIDIGFHFPGWSRKFQSRSILVQLRLYQNPEDGAWRAIGIEVEGFDYRGSAWKLSTISYWQFIGASIPTPEIQEKLKGFCQGALTIFT
jgi:hypothetical protein